MAVLSKTAIFRGIVIGSRTQFVPHTTSPTAFMLIDVLIECRFEDMNRLITAHKLRPVVDKVFDFDRVRDAYAYMASQQHVGKVVVKVSKD